MNPEVKTTEEKVEEAAKIFAELLVLEVEKKCLQELNTEKGYEKNNKATKDGGEGVEK